MTELEERLGYEFRDTSLLQCALTTPAHRMDHPDEPDNQRLEFLGDAVIGLLSADSVFHEHPDEKEGALTVRRTHLVSTKALASAAETLGLRAHLLRNKGASPLPPCAKALTDALEAVFGAIWLDGGLEAARRAFARLDLPFANDLEEGRTNPKGYLQVKAQSMKPPRTPLYSVISTEGPDHAPTITAEVQVRGLGSARASGPSRNAAEAAAATALLESMKAATGTVE